MGSIALPGPPLLGTTALKLRKEGVQRRGKNRGPVWRLRVGFPGKEKGFMEGQQPGKVVPG